MRLLISALIFLALLISQALARDPEGRYTDSPLKNWFKSLHNKRDVSCCEQADGQRVEAPDWRHEDEGAYSVRLNGEWVRVDPSEVISENKVGYAIVWLFQGHITCFMPGGEN